MMRGNPPVVFLQQPIDTTGGGKVQGPLKCPLQGPGDGESESETDSDEDVEDDGTHKLRQSVHAARLMQPITVRIRVQFDAGDHVAEVFIQKEFCGITAPEHTFNLLQLAFKSLEVLSPRLMRVDAVRNPSSIDGDRRRQKGKRRLRHVRMGGCNRTLDGELPNSISGWAL
jgi:hypothetical protein